MNHLPDLVWKFVSEKTEDDWFECKDNWYDANHIGEYISSLSNAAALAGRENGYLIQGADDDIHEP